MELNYLQKRAADIVDGLDQANICNAHSGGSQSDNVSVSLMQLLLGLNVRLPVVIEEAPDVGELGEKGTGNILEWRSQVCQQILAHCGNAHKADSLCQ